MKAINNLLSAYSLHPVLVDVGASGQPPEIWKPLAKQAMYVGFDPDRRDISELSGGQFWQSKIINQAVIGDASRGEVEFFLTKSPHCSSLLPPDSASLKDYLFADLFTVEGKVSASATTLTDVLKRLELSTIDWLKVDTQGVDLQIYKSLDIAQRRRLLAVDLEPGLINAYQGEDFFIDVQRALLDDGFWLSNLAVKGSFRIRQSSLPVLKTLAPELTPLHLERTMRPSPGWCEARYLRTLPSLEAANASREEYLLLWCFALLDEQVGFALDIGVEFARLFNDHELAQTLQREAVRMLQAKYKTSSMLQLPRRVWQKAKRTVLRH